MLKIMNMTGDQGEEKDQRIKKHSEIPINRGVELMLRRENREPKRNGLTLEKKFTLLKNQFFLGIEFTWRKVDT